ncbi:hypothetical protein CLV36_11443 [Laceyella sediminis]|uniref:Uncharacterized protein n=1 Tax=Laceyella sediminis TaxID=573074 RepID=A0ABX5EKK6_9BACL|nr:hypothetical protein [Laceyella sediminis]PRZ12379.1 hypothetical protein CLV36_11443 [Laceyella sediminis]
MGRAFLPFAQRLMNIGISGGAAAFADSVVFDWLKGKWPSIKKASIAALIGLTFGFGGVALAHHGQTIVSKINSIPLTNVSVFKDGTASAPKTVGDTAFGSWLKKFSVETGNGVSGSGNKKVKRDDLVPGSSEHKAQRWKEYQENGGQMSYSHWSKLYDGNMGKPTKSHQIVDEYRNTLPWKGSMQVSVKTPYGRRLLDIANEEMKKAIEHKTTIKEGTVGYFSLNERIREEVAKDAYLVKEEDWDITWVFENADASEPLKQALKENGIKIKFENDGD